MVWTIRWPMRVSALRPVPVEVGLVPPPGVGVMATVRAVVIGPLGEVGRFDLSPREGNLYVAEEPLQFPLEPPVGEWRVLVSVESVLDVQGERELAFRPAPISFRDLANVLPAGATLRVPEDFREVVTQGDALAGGRAWRYEDGEVGLWWAPGPTKPLALNNAVVMLEATHDPEQPPQVLGVEETEWQGYTAFLFREEWPADQAGAGGRPAEALVVQGPDYHLYVLRVRALEGQAIPALMRLVGETFALTEE